MLSFVSSTVQSKYTQPLQRRRANVKRQLNLWPVQKPPQGPDIWEDLDHQERSTLIAVLARLISKMVYPDNLKETQEKKYE